SYKDYTKLPFGRYTFRAKAINLLDNCESETEIQFSIAAPWYASVPAFAFYFFLLSVLGYILLRMAENISKKRTRELEKEKNAEIERLKTQTLENDLKHKSHDLASSTMNLIRKTEILLDINGNINKTLGYIRDAEMSKTTKLLNKIQMDIKENIEHDDYWQKFEHNFDIVYESYLKRLGERYPSISIGDKRLCAYLKMGMSSKEIAMLLNMSVHSVEMARDRLRKKMELNRDVNLVEFLQHF
ncbi:MAG: helix-turn-helix transcriptional regulator, partial [Bacteroidales bacterium]|nr:helix-turn-helix transcriptional regulator [Bacteroidales bacterium]